MLVQIPKKVPEGPTRAGQEICSVCGGEEFACDHERGEVVYAIYGAVVGDNLIDLGPELGSFGDMRALRARAGLPITASKSTTAIGDKDAKSKELGIKRELEAIGLRTDQGRSEWPPRWGSAGAGAEERHGAEAMRRAGLGDPPPGAGEGVNRGPIARGHGGPLCGALKTPRTLAI